MKEILTPAQQGKLERNKKIVALYKKHVENCNGKAQLYWAIAEKTGVSYQTVIRTLKTAGVI